MVQGSAVTFDCSTNVNNSELLWFNDLCDISRSISSCRQYVIYNGGALISNFPPRFKVTEVNNATHITRDLSIILTQLTDAGVYLCAELVPGIARVDTSSAQLIVLGNYIGYAYSLKLIK